MVFDAKSVLLRRRGLILLNVFRSILILNIYFGLIKMAWNGVCLTQFRGVVALRVLFCCVFFFFLFLTNNNVVYSIIYSSTLSSLFAA